MSQTNNTTNVKTWKHLNYEKRIRIEALSKAGLKSEEIAKQIGCSGRTVRRELRRGLVEQVDSLWRSRNVYSADVGQQKHNYAGTGKGPCLKIGKDFALIKFVEDKIIKEKMSPYAAAQEVKKHQSEFTTTISYKTIYNYIDMGLFPNLTNKHLPVKKSPKKRKYDEIRPAYNHNYGSSISERPKEINSREEYGHWEMDTVVGKQGTKEVLLVLTERKTLKEIVRKIKSKSEYHLVRELDKIERKMGSRVFRETFKTITCDNGSENLDFEGIERSAITNRKRTKVYYAHPYSAWERGSNENANKLIRRFIPKGSNIKNWSTEQIELIECWMNNYPRRKFNGLTPNEMLSNLGYA